MRWKEKRQDFYPKEKRDCSTGAWKNHRPCRKGEGERKSETAERDLSFSVRNLSLFFRQQFSLDRSAGRDNRILKRDNVSFPPREKRSKKRERQFDEKRIYFFSWKKKNRI